jgi:uncharacterized phage infection (PIP) family protein YhgE
MEETLKLILSELIELKEGQEALNTNVSSLSEAQQEMKQDISSLKEGQEALNTNVSSLNKAQQEMKQNISNLNEAQQEMKQNISSVKEGQQELKKDVLSIKENLINGLGPYFEQIEKHIDGSKDELKGTIEDQKKVIDTLAVRSIMHESEIRDFKHILKNQ